MPELPEVEIARRTLARGLGGKVLTRVTLPPTRVLRGQRPRALERALVGRRVAAVERRGKWLRLVLDEGALYSHLGMTGKWVRRDPAGAAEPYERARLDAGRRSLRYLDPRLFGRLLLSSDGTLREWDALGPDPLLDGIDAERLASSLARRSGSIKEALLDQSLLAGIGNIQATEALWRARIAPTLPARALDGRQVRALARGLVRSIEHTLTIEGASEITYVEEAGAPNPFYVYGRAGERCPKCGTQLERIVQGGRSTIYCPRCQSIGERP